MMMKEQLTLNAATQEIELGTNPTPKTVRLSPVITITLTRAGGKEITKIFDSLNSYDDALEFLLDAYMVDDDDLEQILMSRTRKKDGTSFSKRLNKVTSLS